MSELSDAEVRVQLALLKRAASSGASDEDLKHLVAKMRGEEMCTFTERGGGGGAVHVKVNRVRSVGPHYEGGTVLDFDGLPQWDPKRTLIVEEEDYRVVRTLRAYGWKH